MKIDIWKDWRKIWFAIWCVKKAILRDKISAAMLHRDGGPTILGCRWNGTEKVYPVVDDKENEVVRDIFKASQKHVSRARIPIIV